MSNAAITIHPKSVSSSPLQELTLVQSICSRTVAANRTHVPSFYSWQFLKRQRLWTLKSIIDLFIHCRLETLKRLYLKMYTHGKHWIINLEMSWIHPDDGWVHHQKIPRMSVYISAEKRRRNVAILREKKKKGWWKRRLKRRSLTPSNSQRVHFLGCHTYPLQRDGKNTMIQKDSKTSFSLSYIHNTRNSIHNFIFCWAERGLCRYYKILPMIDERLCDS